MGSVRLSGRALAGVLALLSASILINYVDRSNLAVAATLLQEELHISAAQLGFLLTAFFWTYTALMGISGWIVDRFNVNWVLAGGFLIWSLATAGTAMVHGFALLVAMRMILGVGESVAFPAYGRILACHVPQQHRGISNAAIMSGMYLGPAVGTFFCALWIAHYGWRPVFLVIGLACLLWLIPWIRWMPDNHVAPDRATPAVSIRQIARRRPFWGAAFGHFCDNYIFYFILTWLPFYLMRERHASIAAMARETALFYVAAAAAAPTLACLADYFVRRGASPNAVRKTCMVIGHIVFAASILGCAASDPRVSFASLMLAGAGSGFVGPNIYVFAQTLAGPTAAGKWTGLQNMVGNFAGIIVGPLSGLIVDATGHFFWAFAICAAVTVAGGLSWVFAVGPLRQVPWPEPAALAARTAA